jgi:hypothetical protein
MNPWQVFALTPFLTLVVSGVAYGLNWRKLGKPKWALMTIFLSIVVTLACVTIFFEFADYAAYGVIPRAIVCIAGTSQFAYGWALARLQNGGYEKWKTLGESGMLAHRYNVASAIRFGLLLEVSFTVVAFVLLSAK